MHLAAEHGHLDLLKVLVASGLDIFELGGNLKVNPCETMLMFGLRRGVSQQGGLRAIPSRATSPTNYTYLNKAVNINKIDCNY
ncbi:hypothetical protein F5B21DRAFT_462396 [Xylaria acuta]|nr:hypothetical protein F5B21DRAFT_462396 [Xylaria acuta]